VNKIKINQLLRLAEKLKELDPVTSRHLKILAEGALTRNHKPRLFKVSALFKDIIEIIKEKFEKGNVSYALVGGLAVRHWVPTRSTDDLDFAVLSSDYKNIKQLFPNGKMGALVYSVDVDNVNVDFLLSDDWDWTEEAIATAEDKNTSGISLRVVKPEYLILYKLESSRDRDLDDILRLLRLEGIPEKTRDLMLKFLPESIEDFDQLVEEAKLGL
jgi:hypothetical protein